MIIRSSRHAAVALVCGAWITAAFTGCDYWPPALQAQIEQLRGEAQAAAADKALLQNQLNAANKAKEELQTRVEDLTRINKEKSSMIANLERALTVERERAAKLTKGSPPKAKPKAASKPALKPAKPPAKVTPKKKSSVPPPKRVATLDVSTARG
jgi:peptidoglycan hydrolase CwlO-like protein